MRTSASPERTSLTASAAADGASLAWTRSKRARSSPSSAAVASIAARSPTRMGSARPFIQASTAASRAEASWAAATATLFLPDFLAMSIISAIVLTGPPALVVQDLRDSPASTLAPASARASSSPSPG